MATRRMAPKSAKRTRQDVPQYQCRHCTFSYDWHEKAYDGSMMMCRCPYYTDGKWCQFLDHAACEHFNLRQGVKIDGNQTK